MIAAEHKMLRSAAQKMNPKKSPEDTWFQGILTYSPNMGSIYQIIKVDFASCSKIIYISLDKAEKQCYISIS